ncbi:OmpA family protein [Altererythrobacter sp. KTW20L]|uniref:OmpA family protein n=1 Tax=Altererythrobacter sp. KTW20L TaxID=2942210 RepID=UPI0020C0B8DE|nr:OmpA family protein [Altererythrobacter sp. KTW20L]MCL6251322.1 OmpA family protein [Altererythrobacter sp. KTW20L]
MRNNSTRIFTGSVTLAAIAMLAMPASAQQAFADARYADSESVITVQGQVPADLAGLPAGPEIEGFISARRGNEMEVTSADGGNTLTYLSDATEIRGRGGFLGLSRDQLASDALLNGLPVTVQTVEYGGGLIASRVRLRNSDLETASMIQRATNQRFGENETAIAENAAATEALRGRVANIDQYNIKGTTNAYFDTGKWQLSAAAQRELCEAAAQAEQMDNALLLVVGYTDNVGDQEFNQTLSERRAGRVVNHLQQQCGWAPWRMLTPTGMAEADPLADNHTPQGRAQNRRVSVNVLVSKAVDDTGMGG